MQLYEGGVWVQSKDSLKLTAQPAQVSLSYTITIAPLHESQYSFKPLD